MKIAQVAPLYESVPPRGYGGTERVVSWLTEELVKLGHDVTLFASGDSLTQARLVPGCAVALRQNKVFADPLAHHILLLEQVRQLRDEFDIIHFHIDYMHFSLSRHSGLRNVTTLHGRLDVPDLVDLYREFDEMPVISISLSQREPLPHANWVGNVYHGLPLDLLRPPGGKRDYLAFLGRISPEKRPDRAIEISTRAGIPLKIAAKVDVADRPYFDTVIRPLLDRPNIEFIGEIGDDQKAEFLGGAIASLAPIDWPEPFGLNLIEAMACGTPTIAFARGSVPEIIENGVSGIIVSSVDEAVQAIEKTAAMSHLACRKAFEQRFSAPRMARDYLAVYEQILATETDSVVSELEEEQISNLLKEDAA